MEDSFKRLGAVFNPVINSPPTNCIFAEAEFAALLRYTYAPENALKSDVDETSPLALSVVKLPAAGVVEPIAPGAGNTVPCNQANNVAFRFAQVSFFSENEVAESTNGISSASTGVALPVAA